MFDSEIRHISDSLAEFNQEITKEYYLFTSGQKTKISLNEIYSKYSFLQSRRAIDNVRQKLNGKGSRIEVSGRLKLLNEALHGLLFGNRLMNLNEELSELESKGEIELRSGEKISYISSINHLINCDSRERREEIRNKRSKFIDATLNRKLIPKFEAENNLVLELGYINKVQMFIELSGIDLYSLRENLKEFLNKTDYLYEKLLSKAAAKIGIKFKDLNRYDILYYLRGKDFDGFFPASEMNNALFEFCRNIGIDINSENGIIIDNEQRATKSPRAFCAPVRVPGEIYLVYNPQGGFNDYNAFMHELGHALHFANVMKGLEAEYRLYGDNSVTEGFALLFDHLLFEKNWIKSFSKLGDSKLNDYFEFCVLSELLMIRRLIAKLKYEIELYSGTELCECKSLYRKIFKEITFIEYDEEEFLYDSDPDFYCARYLRAWMLQASLRKKLFYDFGENWFLKKDSFNFLKELWRYGQKYNAEEIIKMYNLPPMNQGTILDNIENMLNIH